jgi:AcrR family transcriptional regulator
MSIPDDPAARPGHSPSPTDGEGRARWGDRNARRRDILAAARTQMADRGYIGLNMRDIAAGAGVSPGTLYSYFTTKEEIFATLYAEAIARHNERITPLCQSATELEPFLVELVTAHLDLHGTYGRYFSLWAALAQEGDAAGDNGHARVPSAPAAPSGPERRGDRLPSALTDELRAATIEQGEIVSVALRRLVRGPRRKGEQRRRIAFIWSVLNGIADQLHSERHRISQVGADELIRFAAQTIAAGLLTNAQTPPAPTPAPGPE